MIKLIEFNASHRVTIHAEFVKHTHPQPNLLVGYVFSDFTHESRPYLCIECSVASLSDRDALTVVLEPTNTPWGTHSEAFIRTLLDILSRPVGEGA